MPDFGQVIGRFVTLVADTADAGSEPDIVPLTGTISFRLNQAKVVETDASPQPTVIVSTPIEGVLDSAGDLCTPDSTGAPAYKGIWLLATNDPDIVPASISYTVSYLLFHLGQPLTIPSHELVIPAGTTVNLASAV